MNKKLLTPIFKSLFVVAFSFSYLSLFAQLLSPSEKQPLYHHLMEVNQEWAKQNLDLPILQKEISFENEVQRIQMHLMLVEQILRKRIVGEDSQQNTYKRLHLMDVLNDYWKQGVFPKNIFHQKRQPYFIDHLGTACAVGYLVREDGGKAFTEKIKKENNYAYISELQIIYPELEKWATENGFTLEELAWIQPGYPPVEQSWFEVGDGGGTDGHINVMKTIGDKLYLAGDFSMVDGVAANSIIAFDGNEWQALDEGVEGEIFAIEATPQGHVIIGGNFTLNNDPEYSNIAIYAGNGWLGLQKGEMNGSVFAMKLKGDLYVGGDFENIDEQPIKYFAKRNISNVDIWNNNADREVSGVAISIEKAMEVNAPVRAIELINDKLLIGGDFTKTASNVTDGSVNQLNTRYLANWMDDAQNWETTFDGEYPPVHSIGFFEDHLAVGGEVGSEYSLSILTDDVWEYSWMLPLDTENGDGRIHGFLEFDEQFYVYGDISNQPLVGTYTDGFVGIYTNYVNGGNGGAVFDKTVRAAAVFQNQVYFAGDFTTVATGWGSGNGEAFNGLVASPLDGTSGTEDDLLTKEIQVYYSTGKLHVSYEELENVASLNIYDLQGRIFKTINLQKGAASEIIDLPKWSAGIYLYQIINEQGQRSGKFAVF